MKILKKIGIVLLLVFIGMQFFRPEKNVDTTDHLAVFLQETNPSPEVNLIMEKACYDCHSNNTVYPWYNNIAPISYWLADHIDHGKGHLNFSEWSSYDKKKKDHKLEEFIEMVEEGSMPLKEYTWTHEDARLSQEQITQLLDWAKHTRTLYQLGQRPQ